jgi:pimeloyl-ACP methyl ester carboxylesterase
MPTIDTPGASLLYCRTGHGPPVLLIQGVGVVGNGWTPQVDGLRGQFTLVSFDNRGIGESVNRDGRLTVDEMAADALAILDAEGIGRVHVAGHSLGGVIAQALALRAPARVKSLAFLCTFAKGKDGATVTLPMLATALRMRIGTRAMRRNAFLELIMPARYLQQTDRPALAARLAPLFGHDLAEQPPIVMKQLGAMSKYDAGSRLRELGTIPTLVVSATEDRIATPATGRALAAAIPGAKYVEIAEAGHGLPIHRPAEINALLAEHWMQAERQPEVKGAAPAVSQ